MKNKNEPLYERFFARIYDPFMEKFESRYLAHRRRRLIAPLQGLILEAGSGTGVNFHHYNAKARVHAVEPSHSMIQFALEKKEKRKETPIEIFHGGIGDPHINEKYGPNSLDAIVSTLVLCTIPDYKAAIDHFFTWLKPGGKLVALEHIAGKRNSTKTIQSLITPVWKTFAGGCHLDRPTDEVIRNAGFRPLHEDYFHIGFPFYEGVFEKPHFKK